MVAAAFFFSVMSVLAKAAGSRLPTMEVVFARSLVTLGLSWSMLRRLGVSPWGNERRLLMVRGGFGFAAVFCFFYAVAHLPLAEATVIQYTNPVFTALIAALVLGEHLRRLETAGVAVSLAGVVLVTQPALLFGRASGLDPVAAGVAVAGAVLSASAYVTVRRLGRSEHPLVIVFWFGLVATAGSAFFLPAARWPRGWEWALLPGVGIAAQGGQLFMTSGLKRERAGRAMAVGYIQIVFATLWGLIFFGDFPDLLAIAGAFLVLAGTFAVARRRDLASREVDRSSG